jgi:hypothetical protein
MKLDLTSIKRKLCNHSRHVQLVYHEHEVGLYLKPYEWAIFYRCSNCGRPDVVYTTDPKDTMIRLNNITTEPRYRWAHRLFFVSAPALAVAAPLWFLSPYLAIVVGFTIFWFGCEVTQ